MSKQPINPDKLQTNPFSFSLKIQATKIFDHKQHYLDNDGVMMPKSYIIEREQTTKIYVSAAARKLVSGLSSSAHRLLFHILYEIDTNCDYIELDAKFYMKMNGIKSIKTYNEALRELCRNNFIAQTIDYKSVYWINPTLFFSGNRISKYPNNVSVKHTL
jgi:hypothetical protein